jgi:hypothetical protein
VSREYDADVVLPNEGVDRPYEIGVIDEWHAVTMYSIGEFAVIMHRRGPDQGNITNSFESPVDFNADFRAARENEYPCIHEHPDPYDVGPGKEVRWNPEAGCCVSRRAGAKRASLSSLAEQRG